METTKEETLKTPQKKEFQAEVGRLLNIVTHALYSQREVFLRELISNAADACDRLRYGAIANPELAKGDADYAITLIRNEKEGTLIIQDNGIGMNDEDLVNHLGTIAKSGTGEFMSKLSGDDKKDINLIGQFGVGFYASFMVADLVTVISKKAGTDQVWEWQSDAISGFTISPSSDDLKRGTKIILSLKPDALEFLEAERLKTIVTTYSNHISFPIRLHSEGIAKKEDDAEIIEQDEQINRGAAPWTLAPSKLDEEQHKEFYRHISHAYDEPWGHIHFKAEGALEYLGLLYFPSERPFDLFNPERVNRVKLYVKRIFITDNCEQLLPSWLRFMRGVVDSEDLPLNVSREMLQNNPVIGKIRAGLIRRVLDNLKKRAEDGGDTYLKFWDKFGIVLKEGLCEAGDNRDSLLELTRFHSTKVGLDQWQSLKTYRENMKKGQTAIYFISGENAKALMNSPHLEGFRAKEVEVLFFTDPVDEFWVGYQSEYDGIPLQSVTRAGADLDKIEEAEDVKASDSETEGDKKKSKAKDKSAKAKADGLKNENLDSLIAIMKDCLKEYIGDVVPSTRLTESPVCLVSNQFGPDLHLERLLKQHKQMEFTAPRILEINPNHALIQSLAKQANDKTGQERIKEISLMLHDQARIMDGEPPIDLALFAKTLNHFMQSTQ